ncbi:penicillin-binding protein 1C [Deltaproteobacteria bacterium]|nr:penicillin-binding protein 1C [Deltaproteobacteria bacterium]
MIRKRAPVLIFLFSLCLPAFLWVLLVPKPPLLDDISFSTVVLDRHGRLMHLSLAEDERYRVFVPLTEVAPALVESTLLYEDAYFYQHPGINFVSLARAAFNMLLGRGRRMGGSTITMQVARLRLHLTTNTVWGKLRQIERALAYERHYSKKEILEAYFNLAPYGGNIEGCGAASRIYYQKAPGKLTLVEALSLSGVPQNPTRRNPLSLWRRGGDTADIAWRDAQKRLFNLWLAKHPEDQGQAFLAQDRLSVAPPRSIPFAAPHVSMEAVGLARGWARQSGAAQSVVRTSIDMRLQRQVENMVLSMIERNAGFGVENAAALLVHWPSMEARALAGSADFWNAGIEGQVDGTRARSSPGSTLKPFIYALALDQGLIHPLSLLYDAPRSFGGYDPENADQEFRGPISAAEALRLSRNIPAITLANRLGVGTDKADLYAFLQSAGVPLAFAKEHYGLALALGGAEISMRDMAKLYALLANRGVLRDLVLFKDEKTLPHDAHPLLSAEACVLTLEMLRSAAEPYSWFDAATERRVPLYMKTGTSNGYRDAWTAGIFGPYVLVVWVGNFDKRPNQTFVGGTIAAPLFRDIAEAIHGMENMTDTPMRGQEKLNITTVPVCSRTGDLNTGLCPEVTQTRFIPGVSPIADSGVYREILLDAASGLRACVDVPGETKRIVWEFWPTDLQRIFRMAGIMKPPPPPFLPECAVDDNTSGIAPEILSPKLGVIYHRSLGRPDGTVVTLNAAGEADVTDFFWFSGDKFIGRSKPGEYLRHSPPGGRSVIRVVDNFGRSQSRSIQVEVTE